ncbi:hypothetical protein CYMTET_35319 [Cymbomonas tetramitiformis]|uniref:Uncharacterized protein n=1 Tax=Cymbomonas tetramitiformis TaxID=36881 RepID=A0AAE0F9C1_9CHLO|nr:hypothetical protein CYMTET_35319 [Cymbomonas tetramitiformis]
MPAANLLSVAIWTRQPSLGRTGSTGLYGGLANRRHRRRRRAETEQGHRDRAGGRKVNAAGPPSSPTASSTTAANCNDGDPAGWRGVAAAAAAGANAAAHENGQTPFVERCPSVIPHKRKHEMHGYPHAIDINDTDRFDALCYLAGGKPVMLEDLSAASLCVGDAVEEHAIDEHLQCCQPADTRFGVWGVGGALHIITFKVHGDAPVAPTPLAAPAAPPSVVSDGGMYLVDMSHAHETDVSFMDKIAEAAIGLWTVRSDVPGSLHAIVFLVCAAVVPSAATAFGGVGTWAPTRLHQSVVLFMRVKRCF